MSGFSLLKRSRPTADDRPTEQSERDCEACGQGEKEPSAWLVCCFTRIFFVSQTALSTFDLNGLCKKYNHWGVTNHFVTISHGKKYVFSVTVQTVTPNVNLHLINTFTVVYVKQTYAISISSPKQSPYTKRHPSRRLSCSRFLSCSLFSSLFFSLPEINSMERRQNLHPLSSLHHLRINCICSFACHYPARLCIDILFHQVYNAEWEGATGAIGDAHLYAATGDQNLLALYTK